MEKLIFRTFFKDIILKFTWHLLASCSSCSGGAWNMFRSECPPGLLITLRIKLYWLYEEWGSEGVVVLVVWRVRLWRGDCIGCMKSEALYTTNTTSPSEPHSSVVIQTIQPPLQSLTFHKTNTTTPSDSEGVVVLVVWRLTSEALKGWWYWLYQRRFQRLFAWK